MISYSIQSNYSLSAVIHTYDRPEIVPPELLHLPHLLIENGLDDRWDSDRFF